MIYDIYFVEDRSEWRGRFGRSECCSGWDDGVGCDQAVLDSWGVEMKVRVCVMVLAETLSEYTRI